MWEQLGHEPLQIKPNCVQNDPRLLAEMDRLHLDDILAHGLPDLHGRTSTFFAFSRVTGGIKEQHRTALELVLPYLHAAWVRSQHEADREAREGTLVLAPEILTSRQVEILNWVQHGKSNSEIAQILNISHLTVKNHVQKILRKLNVQNRAQAVGRGLALRILSM
jgi:transcriptional regulator EpsA